MSGAAVYGYVVYSNTVTSSVCQPLGGRSELRSALPAPTVFDAVTEYQLPNPSRWSNGIAVSDDGSVWFGEQSVPGVGHLFTNGTLVEYAWPTAPPGPIQGSCAFKSSIWGIAIWKGMVWGADGDQNALIGLNPSTGAMKIVNITGFGSFPYTLSVGPDGALWFTMLAPPPAPAAIGRMAPDYGISVYKVANYQGDVPTQVQFVNSTYAYYVGINLTSTTGAGGLFSFDPQDLSAGILPTPVGSGFRLLSPNSLALSNDTIWVTQHGAASVASFNTSTGKWTIYPTSVENYTLTTLPYFVQTEGGTVWFNEHYGNKIAVLDPKRGTLTEYSEANPPVYNGEAIGNDLTIASTRGGLWFTSVTGNYIGFVNASYRPDFSLLAVGTNSFALARGQEMSLQLVVNGTWSSPLRVQVSDSENFTSIPDNVMLTPLAQTIAPGSDRYTLQANLSVGIGTTPGRYTLAVTVTDGLVYRSVYLFLNVTG